MSEPKTPESQETQSIREIDEQTQKHIDRFLEGREAWNKWANEMLTKKEELKKAGKWKVEQSQDDLNRYRTMSVDPSAPEIQAWLDEAYIDFSNLIFQTEQSSDLQGAGEDKVKEKQSPVKSILVSGDVINFTNFIFPSEAYFNSAEFHGRAYFNSAEFQGWAYFNSAKFQGWAYFNSAEFQGMAYFNSAEFQGWANFDTAKFQWVAYFNSAEFQGEANFGSAKFQWVAVFGSAEFYGRANFNSAKFQEVADFNSAKFQRMTFFNSAKFQGVAYFNSAKFQGVADFNSAEFHGGANFELVDFERHANFSKTKFNKAANFEAILVKRAFSLADAEFTSNIPNYTQANFAESPRLDNIEVLPAPTYKEPAYIIERTKSPSISPLKCLRYWWNLQFLCFLLRSIFRLTQKIIQSIKYTYLKYIYGPLVYDLIYNPIKHIIALTLHGWGKFTNIRRNPDEEAHYRALKRLAIQAHDHENEMKFFAGEIRSRRHITDCLFPWKKGFASSARYWAGVFYELFSDFGRSFIRPTLWWFACLWLFANLTLSSAGLDDKTKCHNSQLTPKEAAYTIGLKNSLLILGLTKTNIVKQAELCLYGRYKNGEAEREPKPYDPKIKRAYQAKSAKVENTKTDIPFKAAVQGIAHSLLSLLFIFLLLLAIRNQFKIK